MSGLRSLGLVGSAGAIDTRTKRPEDALPTEQPFWWVSNPVSIAGRILSSTCDDNRQVWLQEWTQPAGSDAPYWVRRYRLGTVTAPGTMDDHSPAGLAAQVGKPLVAFFSAHNFDNRLYYRISTKNIEDIKPGELEFGPLKVFEVPASENTSYSVVHIYGSDIYVMHRTGPTADRWRVTKFPAWATGTPVSYEIFSSADQFYCASRVVGNKLRCMVSDHPSLGTDNQIWYAQINLDTGSITKADGTTILGNLDGTNLPLAEASLESVFTSATTGTYKPWGFDIGYGSAIELIFVDGRNPPNFASTAKYKFATYSAGTWTTRDIANVGDFIGGSYFPSICAVPGAPGTVLLAREAGGTHFLEQQVTTDAGATWATTTIETRTGVAPGTYPTFSPAQLTRAFPVRQVDGVAPFASVMATSIDRYNGIADFISQVRPVPTTRQVRRLADVLLADSSVEAPPLGGVYLNGTSGSYISTPDFAIPSEGLRVEVDVALDSWASGSEQDLLGKEASSSAREFKVYVNADGKLGFGWSTDGTTLTTQLTAAAPGFTAGQRVELFFDFVPSFTRGAQKRGAFGYRLKTTDPWTTFEVFQTVPATSIFDTASAWEIGSRWGGTSSMAAGMFYRVAVKSVGGGTVLAEWRGDKRGVKPDTVVGKAGRVWTFNGAAAPAYTSAWNGTFPFKLGSNYLWFDAGNNLRRKIASAPTSDTDGFAYGVAATAAAANFNSLTDAVNTTGKYQGKQMFSTTAGKPVWTNGATAGAVWVFADGTTAYTPV